jgi:NAD-dependent dihydropyrimidine dehydrogenase PreA subunit
MPIATRRAKGNAQVIIDHEHCSLCGLCVEVCKGKPLFIQGDRVCVDQSILFGCIGCGQCAAVCPQRCIIIEGRDLSAEDLLEMPPREQWADYTQFHALLQSRRSTKIFSAGKWKERSLKRFLIPWLLLRWDFRLRKWKSWFCMGLIGSGSSPEILWVFSKPKSGCFPAGLSADATFIGKDVYGLMKTFVAPLPKFFSEKMARGEDWLLYDAPLAMYFHASPTADPMDYAIAATYAMLAAQSLGLGTCMIGSVAPFLKYKNKINNKYGIPKDNQQGLMVIFGYPQYKYTRSIKRSLGNVKFYEG